MPEVKAGPSISTITTISFRDKIMQILGNIVGWAIILLILYAIRKPIFRFFKNVGNNAYNRAVAWIGGFVFLVIVAFVVFLFTNFLSK